MSLITASATILLALTGCHVVRRIPATRTGDSTFVRRDAPPRALTPTLEVAADGRLRFVVPQLCMGDVMVELENDEIVQVRPNLATFIVGIIATSIGAVVAGSGLASGDAASSPATYLGAGGVVVGLPLAIGPMRGTSSERIAGPTTTVARGSREEPCETRGLAAASATVQWNRLTLVGDVDGDGYFAIEPFAVVDAFDPGKVPAIDVRAEVELADGSHLGITKALDAGALAPRRDAFLARAEVDGTVEPLRKVPRLEGVLKVARVAVERGVAIKVSLEISNDGPGDAFQVRGTVATAEPELDGRIIYVGRVPAGGKRAVAAVLALSPDAAGRVGGSLALDVELADAHRTAPTAPLRFQGTLR